MADEPAVKKESKPADFSTAILERKKAPNRLIVGTTRAIARSTRRARARRIRRSVTRRRARWPTDARDAS